MKKLVYILILLIAIVKVHAKNIYFIKEIPEVHQDCIINYRDSYFIYSDSKNCKDCKKYQDIITLLITEKNLDALEIFKFVYNFTKICPQKPDTKTVYDINLDISNFFQDNLYSNYGKKALKYLKNRSLTDENIKEHRIGYALDNKYILTNYLIQKGYPMDLIAKTEVITKLKTIKHDFFYNRIIFPFFDSNGKIIGFNSRSPEKVLIKYLETKSLLYKSEKGLIFNLSQAKNEIKTKGYVIVFEGYFDSIVSSNHGIKNVVSIMTYDISQKHLINLFSITDNIYICLDNDPMGNSGMSKISELALHLLTGNRNIYFVKLPVDTDVDEVILKNGVNKFYDLLENDTKDIYNYIWAQKTSRFENKKPTAFEKIKLRLKFFRLSLKFKDSHRKKEFRNFYKDKLKTI